MSAATAYKITYKKSTDFTCGQRYNVQLDGETVGWVIRWSNESTWSFHASVRQSSKGETLVREAESRRDAVMYGISELRIYHLGRVVRFDLDTISDVVTYFDNDRLDATYEALLDAKYA